MTAPPMSCTPPTANCYLGLADKFRFVKFLLSTAGSGGTVSYSYWDGSNWVSFTPEGGLFHLTSADFDLSLWDDLDSIPLDWQKKTINSSHLFWVKIEVSSAFSIAPVGSQITAINNIEAINIRR